MPEMDEKYVAMATDYGIKIAGALALLIISFIIAAWVRSAARKGFEKAKLDATLSVLRSAVADSRIRINTTPPRSGNSSGAITRWFTVGRLRDRLRGRCPVPSWRAAQG